MNIRGQNGRTNPDYATNATLAEQITKRRTIENIADLTAAERVA